MSLVVIHEEQCAKKFCIVCDNDNESSSSSPSVLHRLKDLHLKWARVQVPLTAAAADETDRSADKIKRLRRLVFELPPALMRAEIWFTLSGAAAARGSETDIALYLSLLSRADDELPETARACIKADVPRTFPAFRYFSGESSAGHKALTRLLQAYAIYDADIGFCQGMSFLAGLILLQGFPEHEAFWVFVQLMQPPFGFRTFYQTGRPGVIAQLYVLDRLIEMKRPKLYSLFKELEVTPAMFATAWFSALFSAGPSFSDHVDLVASSVIDLVFIERSCWCLQKTAFAILTANEDQLLRATDAADVLVLLHQRPLDQLIGDTISATTTQQHQLWFKIIAQEKLVPFTLYNKLLSEYTARSDKSSIIKDV